MKPKRYKLRLCPCCGRKAELKVELDWWDGGTLTYMIKCEGCGLNTGKYRENKWATEAWNRRCDG